MLFSRLRVVCVSQPVLHEENNKAVYYDGFIIFFAADSFFKLSYFTPFANQGNWVHIGCKMKQNISIFQKSHPIKTSVYRHLSAPCIATKDN
jgi:hypothetical protein